MLARGKQAPLPRWWLPLVGSAAAAAAVLLILGGAELTSSGPPPRQQPSVRPAAEARGAPRSLHLAGTGTWLPLARGLVEVFEDHAPEIDVIIHGSIGSRGGVRALEDGAVDIGLTSWPAERLRRLEGVRAVAVARAAVVFALHPSVHTEPLTEAQLLEIFSGARTRWPDGSTIVPLLREEGDSATGVASQVIDGFEAAIAEARRLERWPTLLTDAEMERALQETPGSIGLHDLGAIRLGAQSLRVLPLRGVTPSPGTIADGSYPLLRTLSLLLPRQGARPEALRFVEFVLSPAGREVILRSGGYQPLDIEAAP